MYIVNTLKKIFFPIGLIGCLQIAVLAADSSNLDRLLAAEADFEVGNNMAANTSYLGLIDSVSEDLPLRVAAWRGALKSSANGESLESLLKRLLKNEMASVQLRALPVLGRLRLMDEVVDDLLIEGMAGSDPAVGVMLVELLSSRNGVDVHSRLVGEFSNSNDQVKGAIIEVSSRGSGRANSDFLMELIFESEEWSEQASESLVAMNESSVDEYLSQFYLGDDGVSADHKALAIGLLRNRGAVAYKDDFYRMLIGSEASVRSAITHALRDWGEAGDLDTILRVMGQSKESALRSALSRLFVSLAQTQVKDQSIAIGALDKAIASADSSLKATLVKMKQALIRESEKASKIN